MVSMGASSPREPARDLLHQLQLVFQSLGTFLH